MCGPMGSIHLFLSPLYRRNPLMKIQTLFITICILTVQGLVAQSASDALRFSRLDRNGGARSIGVLGSLGALGADFGVMSTNPAGLAAFRRSELSLSTGLYHISKDSRLLDGDNSIYPDDLNRFHFNNGGIVAAHRPRRGRWKSANLGIGITQLATYRSQSYWEGNAPGSLTDRFVELADGIHFDDLDEFEAGLAYEAGAIYDLDGDQFYTSDFLLVPDRSELVVKNQTITTSGYQNELQLGFAGNYDHKLFLGATVGIPILNYQESKRYEEADPLDTIPFFNSLSWQEDLQSSGTGVNLKLGMIYRVSQMIRLGAAVHTPTAFAITDNYNKRLEYSFTQNGQIINLDASSPDGVFDYRLYTPWRLIGDLGIVLGGRDSVTGRDRASGFLSAEVEWVDYSTSSFNFTKDIDNAAFREAERQANQDITQTLQDALNVRFGGELAYRIFRFRAGLGFSGTEYANEKMWSRSWSAGLGIRERNFYIDLGFRRQTREEGYTPYATANAPEILVNTEQIQDLFVMTLGIKL